MKIKHFFAIKALGFSLFLFIFILPPATAPLLGTELLLYSGAGLRKSVDRVIPLFESETGHRILVEYGGAGKLMTRFLATGRGDLFLPGSYFYILKLKEKGLVVSDQPVVEHTPVVAVNRKTKATIDRFEDLARPGLKLALGDPQAMAFGRTSLTILQRSGLKAAIQENTVVYGATISQLALYVEQGSVDAAIIGRSDAVSLKESIRWIPVPPAFYDKEIIAAAILKTSRHREAAKRFQKFLTSTTGIKQFTDAGFLPIQP